MLSVLYDCDSNWTHCEEAARPLVPSRLEFNSGRHTGTRRPPRGCTRRSFLRLWIRNYGQGRVFYSAFGHEAAVFWNPTVLRHYLAGIQFALGDLPAGATPSAHREGNSEPR